MAGLLIVYLLLFASDEGNDVLSQKLGKNRLADFIHCFELMLLLENFCKLEQHDKGDLNIMRTGIPAILDFYKNTLNRKEGNGMKIIKFHLCLHYVDDIRRFGSMRNYDSCIGERHHCTEVKDPARHTQRRKCQFEIQTAQRYVDNVVVNLAKKDLANIGGLKQQKQNQCNKHHNIIYDRARNNFFKKDYKTKKYLLCNWIDKQLYNQLKYFCKWLVDSEKVNSPIRFFTQHNRDEFIFRGDPNFCNKGPWYDWVNVDWNDAKPVPAKINIFMDLSVGLKECFQVGTSIVNEPGYYAIAYSCLSFSEEMRHPTSLLVEKNELIINKDGPFKGIPELCMFSVECIDSTCIATPYCVKNNISNAIQWSILRPRKDWNNVLINFLKYGYESDSEENI